MADDLSETTSTPRCIWRVGYVRAKVEEFVLPSRRISKPSGESSVVIGSGRLLDGDACGGEGGRVLVRDGVDRDEEIELE